VISRDQVYSCLTFPRPADRERGSSSYFNHVTTRTPVRNSVLALVVALQRFLKVSTRNTRRGIEKSNDNDNEVVIFFSAPGAFVRRAGGQLQRQ
jgi:hypothetical protein